KGVRVVALDPGAGVDQQREAGGVAFRKTVLAEAFDLLYYLEKASEVQVLALSTGRPLSIIPDEVAAHAARQWREYPDAARLHMDALMAILDEESPDYAK
ncbi:MAG: hypothetical protein EBZ00_07735, partial [Actinobacteria bacterium]|nr:hypothetical protein [Actinomycetota bacterium]